MIIENQKRDFLAKNAFPKYFATNNEHISRFLISKCHLKGNQRHLATLNLIY